MSPSVSRDQFTVLPLEEVLVTWYRHISNIYTFWYNFDTVSGWTFHEHSDEFLKYLDEFLMSIRINFSWVSGWISHEYQDEFLMRNRMNFWWVSGWISHEYPDEFLMSIRMNLLFSYLCTKSKLEEPWRRKIIPIMSHKLVLILCLPGD